MATKAKKKAVVTTIAQAPSIPVETKIDSKINLSEIAKGDIFSEMTHYKFTETDPANTELLIFDSLESGQPVKLTKSYVLSHLFTADQYTKEVIVGKEDKLWTQKQVDEWVKQKSHGGTVIPENIPRVGDIRVKGIRTIWEEITDSHVLMVSFVTQGKALSAKEYDNKLVGQATEFITKLEAVKKSKKGVTKEAIDLFEQYQQNPVTKYEAGTERVLRGYKIQFSSRDGRYNCVDMDITDKHNIRPVNINTINWLVYNGVKYVVE